MVDDLHSPLTESINLTEPQVLQQKIQIIMADS